MRKNNKLIESNLPDLELSKNKLYERLLSDLHKITDCIYIHALKDDIIHQIKSRKELSIDQLKQKIKHLIRRTNDFLEIHLTNFPITSIENNVIPKIKVQKKYNGFTNIIQRLYNLCDNQSEQSIFNEELTLLLLEILKYEKLPYKKLDVFLDKNFKYKNNY